MNFSWRAFVGDGFVSAYELYADHLRDQQASRLRYVWGGW